VFLAKGIFGSKGNKSNKRILNIKDFYANYKNGKIFKKPLAI